MTATSPQPRRRRWRWALALLLVIGSVVGWWYYPRGDARFVGRWTYEIVVNHEPPHDFIQLSTNGTGTFYPPGIEGLDRFSWYVDDGQLILRRPRFKNFEGFCFSVRKAIEDGDAEYWLSGPDPEVYRIIEVSPEQILCKRDMGYGTVLDFLFRRIPN